MSHHRDVGKLLQMLRNFLLGRNHITSLRFEEDIACRDYPPPCYPPAARERISGNQYYDNDPRGQISHPLVIANSEAKPQLLKLDEGKKPDRSKCGCDMPKMPATPGKVSGWDEHYFYKRQ